MATCPHGHHHHHDHDHEGDSDYEEYEARITTISTEDLYKPYRKHPELYVGNFHEEWLHPDMIELVKTVKNSSSSKAAIGSSKIPSNLLKEEAHEIYSFNCFDETFLSKFNDEIQHFYETAAKYNIPIDRPNSMNNYGVILNEIGMRPLISSFQQEYLWPLARVLFPREGEQFDTHHTFLVRYQAEEDLGLDMHTDDSDVTFNVCLGETNFTGATLQFCGNLGDGNHRQHSYTYYHKIGRAVLHKGNRRHGADDIQSGTRTNLIVWNKNYTWRKSIEYQNQMFEYESETSPPDMVCLSFAHDRDYIVYKDNFPTTAKLPLNHRGWCPPQGKEYPGYKEMVDQALNIEIKKRK